MYTESQVAALMAQDVWTYAEAIQFAEANGLKPRSVISKIKHLGLTYITKPVVTKTGDVPVRKAELVNQIETAMGITVASLVKATKADLERLADVLSTD